MKKTEQTLLEQMRITEFDIEARKALISFKEEDFEQLKSLRSLIESKIDNLVSEFYKRQTEIPEIALLIGDADTLARLISAQRNYVLDLFSGIYDLEYVNNRLRIGLVHKRIGVEPKLYLSANLLFIVFFICSPSNSKSPPINFPIMYIFIRISHTITLLAIVL